MSLDSAILFISFPFIFPPPLGVPRLTLLFFLNFLSLNSKIISAEFATSLLCVTTITHLFLSLANFINYLYNFIFKYRLNKFLLQIYQTYVIITSEFYINPMLTIVKGDNLYEQ